VSRSVLDPISRVGGPLRVEIDLDGGVVADAWVSGTMYRGLEQTLVGRDARDAWLLAQRVCGSCGTWHAQASVRAVEQALGIHVPRNARLIRSLLAGIQLVVEHAAGFYQMQALDWVDLSSALAADPAATSVLARSLGDAPNSSAAYFKAIRARLSTVLGSGQPGPLANGFAGHPAYRLRPEANLLLGAHYLEAFDWRRRILRSHVILGGKSPHAQTYLVGGMSVAPDWGGPTRPVAGEHAWKVEKQAPAALSLAGLDDLASILGEAKAFVDEVYLPDVLSIMKVHPDWSAIGRGHGHYLSFGDFAEDDSDRPRLLLPRGRVMDADLRRLVGVAESGVGESTRHAWYAEDASAGQGSGLRHPSDGRTEPRYAGPRPPFESLTGFDRYSWVKAPRYEDDPMEVGPLARVLVGAASGSSVARKALVDATAAVGIGPDGLFSTLGRTVGRAAEASIVAGNLERWLQALRDNLAAGDLAVADITLSDPATWPRDAEGWAIGESPGGATGHWVAIRDHRIERYQIVDGSTWNASPRDGSGRRGAMEEALIGTAVADPERPIEVLRTIRSFAPCLSCAVH